MARDTHRAERCSRREEHSKVAPAHAHRIVHIRRAVRLCRVDGRDIGLNRRGRHLIDRTITDDVRRVHERGDERTVTEEGIRVGDNAGITHANEHRVAAARLEGLELIAQALAVPCNLAAA